MAGALLEVEHLRVDFPVTAAYTIHALADISFTAKPGEIIGLVGESGCGKSTLARTIMGLYQPCQGTIRFGGTVISSAERLIHRSDAVKRDIQMIFQDADGALNPYMTVEQLITEALVLGRRCRHQRDINSTISALLAQVGLEEWHRQELPGELSGGQRQRIGIARCLGMEPGLIIADEPIAALDVSIQAQILNLLQQLQRERHFTLLFIAHDLAVIRHICDRVFVMYEGRIVEAGPVERVFTQPQHTYTKKLLQSILYPDPVYERSKRNIR
jgi:ABC-type oligopeptide transport system ATPase subunit